MQTKMTKQVLSDERQQEVMQIIQSEVASFFEQLIGGVAGEGGYLFEGIIEAVEAVQIEWISNGILVRGKGADGAFCNYYRDTSAFVSQHLNGKTFDFVKGKEPKTGDKCVVYFGIADADIK